MTKKTRTILILIFLVLFIFIAPSVVFYSQGYRFDFETKKIVQTGGFYFKVLPKNAEIYIDGKLIKKTDFFFGSALIENLLPKKYKIEIKKEGYHSWEKTLEIKEKQVTEAKNIALIPKNPSFDILTKEVKNFWFSPDEKKIILKESDEQGWALKLYDLNKNLKSHLLKETDFSKKGAEFLSLKFLKDSKEISLEVGVKEQIKYFTLEIDKTPPVLTESENPLTFLKDIITLQVIEEDIYYLDDSGHLFKTDASFSSKTKITEIPFELKQETEYKLKVLKDLIFLLEEEALYQFDQNSKSFKKIFEPVKELAISSDFKKLAFFNNYEIWTLFLDSEPSTGRQKGDIVFLTRFSEKIEEVFWLTNHYLMFNVGNKIKIAEIDDRDKINIVDLAEFENPKISWGQNDKKLYILSNGNLYASEMLMK